MLLASSALVLLTAQPPDRGSPQVEFGFSPLGSTRLEAPSGLDAPFGPARSAEVVNSYFKLDRVGAAYEGGGSCAPDKVYVVTSVWTNSSNCSFVNMTASSFQVAVKPDPNVFLDGSLRPENGWVVGPGQALFGTFRIKITKCQSFRFFIDLTGTTHHLNNVQFRRVNADDTLEGTATGQRFFPERRSPADTVDRNDVGVVASVTPPVAGIRIDFKNFDMDDPSDLNIPYVDPGGVRRTNNATDVDANGTRGDDNFADPDPANFPKWGRLHQSFAVTDSSGEAAVRFRVNRQPGNNFAVTAAAYGNYSPAGIDLDPADGSIIRNELGAEVPVGPRQACALRTPLLTIWRTMHVEVDHMNDVTGAIFRGNIRGAAFNPATNQTTIDLGANLPRDPVFGGVGLLNRYEDGELALATRPAGCRVLENTANAVGTPDTVIVVGDCRADAGTAFAIEDDDRTHSFPNGAAIPAPNTSRLAGELARAFIEVRFDLDNPNQAPPFVVNIRGPAAGDLVRNYQYDNRALRNRHDFWTVYVLGAFQAEATEDGDPDLGTTLPNTETGLTGGIVDEIGGAGAHIFLEALDDAFPPRRPATRADGQGEADVVLHEVAHLLGAEHDDLGLMRVLWNQLTNASLRRLRSHNRGQVIVPM